MSPNERTNRTVAVVVAASVGVAALVALVLWRSAGGTPADAEAAARAESERATSGGRLGRSAAAESTTASPPETTPGPREPVVPPAPSGRVAPSVPSAPPLPTGLGPGGTTEAPPAAASGVSAEVPEPEGPRGSLRREDVRSVIRGALPELRFCFEWQLNQHPALAGQLTMEFTIDENGTVREAHVAEDLLADDTVSRCFTHVTSTLRFPAPDPPGEVLVRYPFVLSGAPPAREPEGI